MYVYAITNIILCLLMYTIVCHISYTQRSQEQLKNEDVKLDNAIKKTKKIATQQILELSTQLRTLYDNHEKLKAYHVEMVAMEKKATLEVEKTRKDYDLIVQSREDMLQQGG